MLGEHINKGAVLMGASAAMLGLVLGGAPACAQDIASERALARTADDASLVWGPCPDFLPAGCGLTVLHGDPGKPNADVFFRLPAGSSLPVHWHTSAERMVLIAGELRVDFEGQAPTTLLPGNYAYGPPQLPHGGACVSTTPCVLFIAFEAPVDAVAGKSP